MSQLFRSLLALSWAGLIFYLTTIPDFRPVSSSLMSWFLATGGHFIFFGIQASLLFFALPHRSLFIAHWPLVLTSLYGLLIELLQRNIPGRSFSLVDLALDTLGAWLFLYAMRKYHQ